MTLTNLVWTTKEGVNIPIRSMATPHLLATIHMIERNRMNNLQSIAHLADMTDELVGYYANFPDEYFDLCDEAERRKLIQRNRNSNSKAITRRK